MHPLNILFFLLVTLCYEVLSQSDPPFDTTVIPVMKDDKTSFHQVTLGFKTPTWDGEVNYLVDLDAPFTWKDCIVRSSRRPACGLEEGCRSGLYCKHSFCKEAQSYTNPICPSLNITAKYGCNLCAVTPLNPISKSCKLSQMTVDLVDVYVTNGRNPYPGFRFPLALSCAPSSLVRSFPNNVHGVAAFSWSGVAFPRQIYYPRVANKFALCLPSASSAPGVIFLGDGPFYFAPSPGLDIKTTLSYTPMIRKSSKSLGFYIKINRISIKGTTIPLSSLKNESVKISTAVPYTTLRSDIYNAIVLGFSKATKSIHRVKAVKPFSLCLKASAIGSVRRGFRVPNIDLETERGKVWTISGDNSMKRMANGATCFAFIDGGLAVKDAIVIGTFQMENNFLFFDMANQKLGFSSSLLPRGTPCNSFNFTEISV